MPFDPCQWNSRNSDTSCQSGQFEPIIDPPRLRPKAACDAKLKAATGTEIGLSDRIEITQDRVNTFADAAGRVRACQRPAGRGRAARCDARHLQGRHRDRGREAPRLCCRSHRPALSLSYFHSQRVLAVRESLTSSSLDPNQDNSSQIT